MSRFSHSMQLLAFGRDTSAYRIVPLGERSFCKPKLGDRRVEDTLRMILYCKTR
jgi:hypothetical protein